MKINIREFPCIFLARIAWLSLLIFLPNHVHAVTTLAIEQSPTGEVVPEGVDVLIRLTIVDVDSSKQFLPHVEVSTVGGVKREKRIFSQATYDKRFKDFTVNIGRFPADEKIKYVAYVIDKDSQEKIQFNRALEFVVSGSPAPIIELKQKPLSEIEEKSHFFLRARTGTAPSASLFARVWFNDKFEDFHPEYVLDETNEAIFSIPISKIKYPRKYRIGYQDENHTRWFPNGKGINFDFTNEIARKRQHVIRIGTSTQEIGLNARSCERQAWKNSAEACQCCLAKTYGAIDNPSLRKDIVAHCLDEDLCKREDLKVLSHMSQFENLRDGKLVEAVYNASIVDHRIPVDVSSLIEQQYLSEGALTKMLEKANEQGILRLPGIGSSRCMKAKNILQMRGFNTAQLFLLEARCFVEQPVFYIIKESATGSRDITSLDTLKRHRSLRKITLPEQKNNYPAVALPFAFLSYMIPTESGEQVRTISIQPKAQGEEFCSFIARHKSLEDIKRVREAYRMLGWQLANFHQLSNKRPDQLIDDALVHGDLKCRNLFYDEANKKFTLIDNDKINNTLEHRGAPEGDIIKILFGNFNVLEDPEIRNLLDNADLGKWFSETVLSFALGYVQAYPEKKRNDVFNKLMSLFNSGSYSTRSVFYDDKKIKAIVKHHVIPAFKKYLGTAKSIVRNRAEEEESNLVELRSLVETAKREYRGNRQSSPKFWGDEIIYSIIIDRFRNGDHQNDKSNISHHQKHNTALADFSDIGKFRHGGDLKGIQDRLDYLVDLGVTAILLSPPFENNAGDYHGYTVSSLANIDRGFGTNEEFRELVKAAHERGLFVILDFVLNHFADSGSDYSDNISTQKHVMCSDHLLQQEQKNRPSISPLGTDIYFDKTFFKFFKRQEYFNRCGRSSLEELEGDSAMSLYGDFSGGLFDVNSRNNYVQQVFSHFAQYWTAFADIDGIRVDAAKHISPELTAFFSTTIRDFSRELGKTNFLVLGEVAGSSKIVTSHVGVMNFKHTELKVPKSLGSEETIGEMAKRNPSFPYPGLNAVYEFGHSANAIHALTNRITTAALSKYFLSDYREMIESAVDLRASITALEIHDWPRFGLYSPHDPYKSKLGVQYLASAEGIPLIYYGQEQGFNGRCPTADKIDGGIHTKKLLEHCGKADNIDKITKYSLFDEFYRQDMFIDGMWKLGSTVDSINELAEIGFTANRAGNNDYDWTQDPFLRRDHMVYRAARQFIQIRKSCSALRWGDTEFVLSSNNKNDVFAFLRTDRYNPNNKALVIVNNNFISQPIPNITIDSDTSFKLLNDGGKLTNVNNHRNVLDFNGHAIEGNSVEIFVPVETRTAWSEDYETNLCN